MRVLFVPFAVKNHVPHTVPLLTLASMAEAHDCSIETAILVRLTTHDLCRRAGITVLPFDNQGLVRTELAAYHLFRPDIVVDDCSCSTGYAATLSGIPRVTIARTGLFRGYRPLNPLYQHSLGFHPEIYSDVSNLGLAQPREIADLFVATRYIVPGIRSIERLPPELEHDRRYAFSGPLLPTDSWLGQVCVGPERFRRARAAVEEFCERNCERPLVVVTLGTVMRPHFNLQALLMALLRNGTAVLSTVEMPQSAAAQGDCYHYEPFLPLGYASSMANLVIHHCGSATYHYPLLHGVPSVTIGTRAVDRDDVAARLEELGLSRHVPDPAEDAGTIERILEAADAQLSRSRTEYRARVIPIQAEIEQTKNTFSFNDILSSVQAEDKTTTMAETPKEPTAATVEKLL